MNSSQLMLAAVTGGLEDDATTSAALDAIREESNCSLLAAVLEVARVVAAAKNARTLKEAVGYLAKGSPIKSELEAEIAAAALRVPVGAQVDIIVEDGDAMPHATDVSVWAGSHFYPIWNVMVGAAWVKRTASQLLVERDRRRRARKFRVKR